MRFNRSPWLVAAFAWSAAGFVVIAQQSQTPAPPSPTGQLQAPQGRGRGLGGGRKDDPINADVDWTKQPRLLAKTPEEQLKTFILQPGYRLELVLADPIIQEPTAIAFDGNGRMFVVEDRSYMLDLDMTGQLDPISRISLHVDTDNDGVYDKHTVFVDNLVFPRFVTPFGPGVILTKESNAQEVWKYTDTNGDGVADKKELFDTGYGRLANIEGQEAFLTWALDNWMYSTYNAFRARWTPHGVLKEPTGSNGGEWGVTQDNDGKIWFESGAPGVPSGFQFPIVYGNFNVPDQFEPDFRIPWGAPIRIADMQGGMAVTRMPDGSLKSVTSSAGNDVFRGHRLPKELVGEVISGEPVARIVRRIHPENKEGLTILHNAYPGNEFIKSLDPYFRPVDLTTAPDGTLYITDMYHGIIQVGNFTGPGSYLRSKIEQYDLDKVIHKGRIWRLVYDGVKPDRSDRLRRDRTVPRMYNETAAQLVRHLSHPNGWWRDTAQQLLVLKQNKSVVPALQTIVRTSPDLLARFHALWTLEGLGALSATLVRQQMEDPEPRMRIQAIRASETLYKAGERSLANDYRALTKDPSVDVVIQAMLTLNRWKVPDAAATIKTTMESNQARGVQVVASTVLNPPAGRGGGGRGDPLSSDEQALVDRGATIYNELCVACHGPDGFGTPKPELSTTMAPPLAGSPRVNGHRDYIVKSILHGLTGPDRQQDVHGRDDADGRQQRRVDCRRVLVRASQLRQHRWTCHGGGRRARAHGNRRSYVDVDRSGTDRVAAGRSVHRRLESEREPSRRRGERRADADHVECRRAATGGDVVPGRAAESADHHGDPVRIAGAWRPRRHSRHGRSRLVRGRADCWTFGIPARIPGRRLVRRNSLDACGRRARAQPKHRHFVCACAGEIRADQPDGDPEDAPAWSIQAMRVYGVR